MASGPKRENIGLSEKILGLAIVLLLAFSALAILQVGKSQTATHEVALSRQLQDRIDAIHYGMLAIGAGVHKFVATGNEEFMAPVAAENEKVLRALRELDADAAVFQRYGDLYAELKPLVKSRMAELTHLANTRRSSGKEAAVAESSRNLEYHRSDQIMTTSAAISSREQNNRRKLVDTVQAASRQILTILWIGTLLTVTLVGTGAWVILRERRRRVAAEASLNRVESELRAAFDLSRSPKVEVDANTRRWIYCNREFCELTGYTLEELKQMTLDDITYPEDRERNDRFHADMQASHSTEWMFEKRYIHKTGRLIWVQLFGTYVRDDEGQVERGIAVVHDITARKATEEALLSSQERLHAALAASGTGTFRWDVRTDEFEVDESFIRLAGLPLTDTNRCSSADLRAVVHPDDLGNVIKTMARSVKDGNPFDLRYRIIRAGDGTVRWVASRGKVAACGPVDAPVVYGAVVDVTLTKVHEDKLRERDEQLRLAIDAGEVGTWDLDLNTNELHWSAQCARFIGLPEDVRPSVDLLMSRINAEDRDLIKKVARRARTLPTDRRITTEFRVVNFSTGLEQWFLASGGLANDPARPSRLTGTVVDITERKHRDEALLQHSALLQERADLLDLSPDAILVRDLAGHIVYWNRGGESLYGIPRLEALGRNAQDLLSSKFSRPPAEVEAELMRNERWHGEVVQKRRDGTDVTVASRWALQRDKDGTPQRVLELHTDITDRKAAEEALNRARIAAEDANVAKSRFLANMSHEIRTPLGVIKGFSELLLENEGDPMSRQLWLDRIHRNSMHLARLVDETLDLSKIEADRLSIDPDEVTLGALIEDVRGSLNPAALAKGLQLKFLAEGELPERITTDPLRLKQILLNVVGNAVKFTDRGFVDVRYRLTGERAGKYLLEFIVRDSGVGIATEVRSMLFQPFVQADSSLTRRFGGTGLGLCISRRLAIMLGGNLQLVNSCPGIGSTFALTIHPGVVSTTSDSGRASASVQNLLPESRRHLDGLSILLVEDSHDNRLLISHLLSNAGARVDTAETGRTGVDRALTGNHDVVLMDLQMPELDGFEATARLRAEGYPRPILALTAHAMKGERDRCLQAGFDEHLTKPIEQRLLIEAVIRHAKGLAQRPFTPTETH